MNTYQWKEKSEPDIETVASLQNAINVNRIIASLLCQRGITDFESAKKFFRPDLSQLHDPFLFKDMHKAVDRILRAIDANEKILIWKA